MAASSDPWQPRLWAFFGLASLASLAVACFDPDANDLLNLQEYSLFQNIQAAILGLALLVNLAAAYRFRGSTRAFWLFLLALSFFYFWRELDLDKELLGARMFSWQYLFQSERKLPLKYKLLLAIPSLLMTTAWLAHLLWRPRAILQATRERVQPSAVLWGLVHFALFFLAQFWDKATMIQRHVKVEIHALAHKDPYAEEALEFLGELAFLFFLITVWRMAPRQPRESWAAFVAWLRSAPGIRALKIAGTSLALLGLLGLAGLALLVFQHQPAAFEYDLLISYRGPHRTQTDGLQVWQGVNTTQLVMLAFCFATAASLVAAGVCLALRRMGRIGLGAALAVIALSAAIPFAAIRPTTKRNARLRVELGQALPETELASLRKALAPKQAMSTLPKECLTRLHMTPGEGIASWQMVAPEDSTVTGSLEFQCEFVDGLRTRQRSTLTQFYAHYLDALALQAAHQSHLPLEVFSRPDFEPYHQAVEVALPEGEWHKFEARWLEALGRPRKRPPHGMAAAPGEAEGLEPGS